jgi:uncharacterized membrane protein YfcA
LLSFLLALGVGLVTGILSGFGIGGGTLLMLYLTMVTGMAQRTAQGINLLYFLPTAGAALILHSKNRYVRWKTVLPAILAGCVTAGLASLLALNLDTGLLKKLFGGFLILTGLSEFYPKNRR